MAKANDFAASVLPVIRDLRSRGISLRGVANILNERRFETARGGKWEATTVRNILARSVDMKEGSGGMSEDNDLSTEERAVQDYQRMVKAHRKMDEALGGDGWHAESGSNEALGQNILREEIGYFGPWEGSNYSFDQQTRDRLLAHGRQDVASTFAMAKSAFKEAHKARRVSVRIAILVYLSLLLNVMILATLWLR